MISVSYKKENKEQTYPKFCFFKKKNHISYLNLKKGKECTSVGSDDLMVASIWPYNVDGGEAIDNGKKPNYVNIQESVPNYF